VKQDWGLSELSDYGRSNGCTQSPLAFRLRFFASGPTMTVGALIAVPSAALLLLDVF